MTRRRDYVEVLRVAAVGWHVSRGHQKQVRKLLVVCAVDNSRQEPARTVEILGRRRIVSGWNRETKLAVNACRACRIV